MHQAFSTINKYYKKFRPDHLVLCFDRPNWRLKYTESDECYSKRIYKGGRRKDQTEAQKQKYAAFKRHIAEFEDIMRQHTTIITLSGDLLEADDCIAAWITRNPDRHHTIVSGDRDFVQLLKFPNVKLMNPDTEKYREVEDPHFFLFEKLFRGEPIGTDNVQNAYPRLRTDKIEAAYKDPFHLTNLRQSVWTNIDGRVMEVGKLLDENKLLMDLTAQPEHIQQIMDMVVAKALTEKKSFSHFEFLKFLGKYQLKNVANQLETFMPMLSKR